jgi:serine/threonine protein kinase/membrane protein involved in colicin uptake
VAEALQTLGRYKLQRKIGSGAMGLVYEALDPKLARPVAIKTILKSHLDEEVSREYSVRFREEAQAVARLNHPNIVQVYDFGEEGDVAFIVMEYIRGKDLKQYFDTNARFELKELVRLMCELLSALDYAHQSSIVHRDIKPANIMLDVQNRVKLMDFGVAKIQDTERTHRTQLGTMVGTPSYMSPEQVQGLAVDHRSDLFSCGIVLYQFLTGQRPFTGGDWTLRKMIVHDDPVRPSQVNAALSPEFDRVIGRALAKVPEARYQSAADFGRALQRVYEGKPAEDEEDDRTIMRPTPPQAAAPRAPEPRTAAPHPAAGTSTGSSSTGGSQEVEVEFWRSIKDSDDPEDFDLYLQQFPRGAYAKLAERKIAKLRKPEATGSGSHSVRDASTSTAEIDELRRLEAEHRRQAEELARRHAEARRQAEKEAEERRAAEAKARQEAEARAKREAEERARREAEERARLEAERIRRENEEKARRDAEARAKREAEERARREAEERARLEAERIRRENEEKARREAESKAKKEAEERAKREAEEKARLEAERIRRENEEKARKEAEAKAKREAEERAKREAEEKARKEAEAKAKREAEERAKREAEEKARKEAEAKAKREAEARAKRESEERAKREAEAKRKREAEERARREAEDKARHDGEEKARRDAEAEAWRKEVEAEAQAAEAQARKVEGADDLTVVVAAPPPRTAPARRSPLVVPAVLGAVLALGAAVAYFAFRSSPEQAPIVAAPQPKVEKVDPQVMQREAAEKAEKERQARAAREAEEKAKREQAENEERLRALNLEAEKKRQAEVEAEKRRQAEAEQEKARQAARLAAEEDKKRKAEAARLAAEEEKKRQAAAKLAAEQEKKRQAEAARLAAEEEKKRQAAAKLAAEEEKKKQAEAARLAAEAEKKRQAAAAAEAEAKRQAEATKLAAARQAEAATKPAAVSPKPVDAAELFRRASELESQGAVKQALELYMAAGKAKHGPSAKKAGDILSGGKGDVAADYTASLRWHALARQLGEKIEPRGR